MSNEARDRVGSIETRGIEPVPDDQRHGKPIGLFWMWFGANMGVLGITLGAALITFDGLNVLQGLLVAVIGAAGSFLLVGLLSVAGKRGGAPGLTLSRAVFGVRGNWGPTLVSWLGFVGWETVSCTTATFALLAILALFGVPSSAVLTAICLLVIVVVTALIGLFGHATIMWIQKWLTWIFGALTLIVVVMLIVKVDWSHAFSQPAGPVASVIGAIGFIAAGTGLGWLSAGADYARYLPRAVKSRRLVNATIWGAAIPLVVLIFMGAIMATSDKNLAAANDPVAAIGAFLPSWMLVPYLLTAVFGLIASADLSMYSSGLNLITGGIKVRRTWAVVVDAVLIVVGGLYITVISQDFYGSFTTFLTLLAVPLVVWGAIFLVDMIGRKHYDQVDILDMKPRSRYWYKGGVNWSAFVSWVIAIVVGYLFTTAQAGNTVWFSGAFASSWVGQNGLGWLVAAIVGAVLYWLIRLVAKQQTSFPVPEDERVVPSSVSDDAVEPTPPGAGIPGVDVGETVR